MKKILLFTVLSIALVSISACSKSDDNTTAPPTNNDPPTKTELLTRSGGWKMSGLLLNGATFFDVFPACTKDDLIKFTADFNVLTDEGATKCASTDPQTYTEKWSFADNETKIILDGEEGFVLKLDATTLVVGMDDGTDKTVITYTGQ